MMDHIEEIRTGAMDRYNTEKGDPKSLAESNLDSGYDSVEMLSSDMPHNSMSSEDSRLQNPDSLEKVKGVQESSLHNADSAYFSASLSELSIEDSSLSEDHTTEARPKVVKEMDSFQSTSSSTSSSHSHGSSSGYASMSSTESPELVQQQTSSKPPVNMPTTNTANHFQGNTIPFLQTCLAMCPWSKWDPITDIKEKLGPELLDSSRELIWGQDEDDQEFEALNAARDGDEVVVAFGVFIAKNHRQLNTMNNERQTILHVAAETCSAALCRLIITRGADGAIADVWGDTPLHIAARLGRADVVKALATTLTKPEVRHPYFRVPYKSLPQDNVQSYNHDGRTPVHLAAQEANSKKHHETLRALSKYARADMDYRRLGDGYAPSHIAIDNGDLDCLQMCLELKADSEVRNFKSETPQQLAYLCERKDMVALCQVYGAGKYQLDYAETEPVSCDEEEEMEVD